MGRIGPIGSFLLAAPSIQAAPIVVREPSTTIVIPIR
jgi:hypothetical protein